MIREEWTRGGRRKVGRAVEERSTREKKVVESKVDTTFKQLSGSSYSLEAILMYLPKASKIVATITT